MTRKQSGADRRRFLQRACLAGTALLAGCSGNPTADSGSGTSTQTATRTATPTETDVGDAYETAVAHDLSSWERYDPEWEPPTEPPGSGYDYEVLAERLEIPWDISFSPAGTMFLTERTGRLLRFESGRLETVAEPSSAIDAGSIDPGSDKRSWLVPGGEGGVLGVAVHPTHPNPPLLYVYFTADTEDGRTNRVVAFDTSADDPAEVVYPIVTDIPADTYHNGGRIAFGPRNYLWITTGDADAELETPERTRDPGSLAGKILRVRPDGTAPDSNPEISDDADPRVYTYGHRNPQGIHWLPDATPVITEHGPGGGDEINVLRAGEDYGWPIARNTGDFESYAETSFQPPVAAASSWAPTGSVFYTGDDVPGLRNRYVFGGLISQQIVAATITPADGPELAEGFETVHDASWYDDDYRAATSTLFPDELGRIRHVEQGPDGQLYAITSNRDGRAKEGFPTERDDRLVRIVPTSN